MFLTLGQARSTIMEVIGCCATDARIVRYANEAQQRLLNKNKWKGSYQHYRFCATNACITLPRQVDTVEAFAVCDRPGQVFPMWYDFLSNGPGILDSRAQRGNVLLDKGDDFVSFAEIDGTDKYIRVYSDVNESANSRILLQGYDENSNWIMTQDNGAWIDGEYVAISTTPTASTKKFTYLSKVIKPVTNGNVRLYSYRPSDSLLTALAVYEPDETTPTYRRFMIPGLSQTATGGCNCNQTDTPCQKASITLLAKLRHIDVSKDTDFFVIRSLPALKLMVMAILKELRNLFDESAVCEGKAVQILEEELSTFLGDGMISPVRVGSVNEYWGGGVGAIVGWY